MLDLSPVSRMVHQHKTSDQVWAKGRTVRMTAGIQGPPEGVRLLGTGQGEAGLGLAQQPNRCMRGLAEQGARGLGSKFQGFAHTGIGG